METQTRKERGMAIAQAQNQIKRIDASTYLVNSQSSDATYHVTKGADGWVCECPDHIYRHIACKHIFAVEVSVSLRVQVASRRIEPIENLTECIYSSSRNIVKDGVRKNKTGKSRYSSAMIVTSTLLLTLVLSV